jgi:NosR/NirI family nitrous oxide reductase transcriptional regulator
VYELRDHLWPWSRQGWAVQPILQIIGCVLAVAVSAMWGGAALGRVPSGIVSGGWFGWSVYEVLLRMSGRRYVQDGPWWQAGYRAAGWMDMVSYVAVKNLLIGAVLLLGLKAFGVFGA